MYTLIAAERRQRLGARDRDRVEQRRVAVHDAHAATAAAGRRLDDHGIADVVARAARCLAVVRRAGHRSRARTGTPAFAHRLDRRDLVAHQANRLGLWADEYEAAFLDALRKVCVLREEAVARDGWRRRR